MSPTSPRVFRATLAPHVAVNLRPRPFARLFIVCASLTCAAASVRADQIVLASREDAYVVRDSSTREWAIGSAGLELVIGFNPQGTLTLRRLWQPDSGHVTLTRAEPDATITIDDQETALQEAGNRSTFLRAAASETKAGVQLSLTFEHRTSRALITRAFAAYPGTPTIETWTHVEVPGDRAPVRVSNLIGWQLAVSNAPVRWVNGLRGSNADSQEVGFTIQSGVLDDGGHIEIGSARRSSEEFVPLILVDTTDETFFGGVIWSGAWRITADRFGEALAVRADFPAITTSASSARPVEFPHSFFGVTDPSPGAESRALRPFLLRGIRKGRPLGPLVTYNTWFPYGARIAESSMAAEIENAAGLGVELFVLDAGWYEGAGRDGAYDFTSGLGSWKVDRTRFQNGLSVLAKLARELGMKFGLWVEPERVALATLDQPGLAKESWLATQDGIYGDTQSAQLCLASEAARRWVFDRLVDLIEEVRPDYLKWDNNFWVNCNRSDHDHGAYDGNYAHVVELYGLLAELRARYPDMLIENVSGGGNRMDYGMLAYTDVGWMDDRTLPSAHVRHNLEGLALAFPPAYLLSFVIDSEIEPLAGAADFSHIARSRMPGILGMTYRYQQLDSELSRGLRLGIAQYKELREITARAYAVLLSGQAPVADGWDIIEEITEDQSTAVIFAFKASHANGSVLVKPRNLTPGAIYEVRSIDSGHMGRVSGERLMRDGLEIVHLDGSRAHVIVLRQPL